MLKLDKIDYMKGYIKRLKDPLWFITIVALALGVLFSHLIIPKPYVGLIKIYGPIESTNYLDDINRMLRYAEDNKSIRAVVLEIDSPGGSAFACEEIFMEVIKLRNEKPVVACVDGGGLSGAYYIATASNYIFAKPASFIGSIGVVAVLPEPTELDENLIVTGPFKRAISRKEFIYEVETIKEVFLSNVIKQREEKLKIGREELSMANSYVGVDALKVGLVDEIGSREDAIEKAAHYARISNYDVIDINKELNIGSLRFHLHVNETVLKPTNTIPSVHFLYIEQGE
ncbi:MAG: S49 family peptidase [Candidatus Hydrothermarchaeota archaeon]